MNDRPGALLAVLGAGLLGETAFALLLYPLLQHYLSVDRGLSPGIAGFVLSAYGMARLAAQLPLGGLADRMDRRTAICLGYGVVIVAGLLFCAPLALVWLIAVGALYGLGHALADPLVPAAVADGVAAYRRGRIVGLLNLAQLIGLALGLALGAFIADLAPAAVGFLTVASANAATLLLLAVGAAPLLARRKEGGMRATSPNWRALGEERAMFMFVVLFLITFAACLLLPDLTPFSQRRLHSSLHEMVLYLIPAAIVGVAALPVGGWISDRVGRLGPLLAGPTLGVVGMIGLSRATEPWHAAVFAIFAVAGLAVTLPASNTALLDVAAPANRALLLGGMMAVQGLAQATGPLAGGVLIDSVGVGTPFVAAAATLWLAVPVVVLFGSTPHDGEPGRVIGFTPGMRAISRAHIRRHEHEGVQREALSGGTPAREPEALEESR